MVQVEPQVLLHIIGANLDNTTRIIVKNQVAVRILPHPYKGIPIYLTYSDIDGPVETPQTP